jgi:serine/threonine-protein phosphatase 2B catalytic subunit
MTHPFFFLPTCKCSSRRFDIANERLPDFDPNASTGIFPAPSMRVPNRRGSGDSENMEMLIKRTLEEDDDDSEGMVDRIADRIAMAQPPQGRPRALKRFETA